jgi:peptide/nickel transport system permease protein
VNRAYVARRLLQVVPAVAGIVVVTFLVIHLAPGDPVVALGGQSGDAAYYADLRERYGLDQPLLRQFVVYVGQLASGDLGSSFVQGRPVLEVIAERLGPTLLLMGTALALSTVAGVALGALAARRPYGPVDLGVSTGALLGHAVPVFWLAQIVLLLIAFRTGWFPIQGMTDARAGHTGWAAVADVAHHLVLPALVLAGSELALTTRVTRTGLLEQLGQDYVRTARAKGASSVLRRHALPNALLPVVSVIGTRIGVLFAGAILTETVFAWPGLGRLLLSATQTRDHPVLLGLVLLVALSVVLANLVTDLAYARIDPRIRYR